MDDLRDVKQLTTAVRSAIAAKQFGYEDVLSPLIAEACSIVMPRSGRPSVNTDSVRVLPMLGGSVDSSSVIKGFAIARDASGAVKSAKNCKVAVFGCSLSAAETETKGTVLIHDARELESYANSEEAMMEAQIKAVAEAGASVVVSGGTISEMALHYVDKYGMMALKITSKWQLRR